MKIIGKIKIKFKKIKMNEDVKKQRKYKKEESK